MNLKNLREGFILLQLMLVCGCYSSCPGEHLFPDSKHLRGPATEFHMISSILTSDEYFFSQNVLRRGFNAMKFSL